MIVLVRAARAVQVVVVVVTLVLAMLSQRKIVFECISIGAWGRLS